MLAAIDWKKILTAAFLAAVTSILTALSTVSLQGTPKADVTVKVEAPGMQPLVVVK